MQGKISMDLSFCQAETGFSLDELVEKVADVFARRAFSELLRMILQMTQEILLYRILHGKLEAIDEKLPGTLVGWGKYLPKSAFKE